LDILSRSGDIRNQSRTLQKIDRNFACFWPPVFFGRALPEFLDLHYKIEPDSDDVAKFRGDRPMDLGDWALNNKNICGETEARPELIVPGGLKNITGETYALNLAPQNSPKYVISRSQNKTFSGEGQCPLSDLTPFGASFLPQS